MVSVLYLPLHFIFRTEGEIEWQELPNKSIKSSYVHGRIKAELSVDEKRGHTLNLAGSGEAARLGGREVAGEGGVAYRLRD